MSNKVLKPKKTSLYQFTQNYSNNIGNCIEFFKSMKWPEVFGDPVLTNALLDRLLHHCSVLNINGPSYRIKDQL